MGDASYQSFETSPAPPAKSRGSEAMPGCPGFGTSSAPRL